METVSYTHLDVYKRQLWTWALYLLSRVVGCRGSLVEVETRMTRFTLFMRIYLFLAGADVCA